MLMLHDRSRVLRFHLFPYLLVDSALLEHAVADLFVMQGGATTAHLVLVEPGQIGLVEEGDSDTVRLWMLTC